MGRDDQPTPSVTTDRSTVSEIERLLGRFKSDYESAIDGLRREISAGRRAESRSPTPAAAGSVTSTASTPSPNRNRSSRRQQQGKACFHCNVEGHFKYNCPQLSAAERAELTRLRDERIAKSAQAKETVDTQFYTATGGVNKHIYGRRGHCRHD